MCRGEERKRNSLTQSFNRNKRAKRGEKIMSRSVRIGFHKGTTDSIVSYLSDPRKEHQKFGVELLLRGMRIPGPRVIEYDVVPTDTGLIKSYRVSATYSDEQGVEQKSIFVIGPDIRKDWGIHEVSHITKSEKS